MVGSERRNGRKVAKFGLKEGKRLKKLTSLVEEKQRNQADSCKD